MIRLLALCALCAIASPAYAQIGPSVGGNGGLPNYSGGPAYGGGSGLPSRHSQNDDDQSKGKEEKPAAPPAAIPGAQPDPDAAVIPADKVAAEMSPNDALFDSITRGDLAAAKDALNRGARLEAHNVLGQTPIDAAIDLNRNDITFLLLSMRTNVTTSRPVRTAVATKPVRAHVVKAAAPARLASDRGVPNPAVGFNGF